MFNLNLKLSTRDYKNSEDKMVDINSLTREQLIERKQLLERKQQLMSQTEEQPEVATPDQYLTPEERFKTGFKLNPEEAVAQEVAKRGLASGTPLEPTPQTASFMANLMDLPNDIVDMIGPAFPVVGQILGGIAGGAASVPTTGGTAAPLAIAGGGVAGAMAGETARQAFGAFLDLEEKGFSDRAKRVAMEGAFGVVGEAAYLGGGAVLKATKKGIVKAGEKLLSKKGLEGFVKGFGKITRNLGPDEFTHALTALKQGDDTVFKKAVASKDFGDNFAKQLFFGEITSPDGKILKQGNVARQIRNLVYKTKENIYNKKIVPEGLYHSSKLPNVAPGSKRLFKAIGGEYKAKDLWNIKDFGDAINSKGKFYTDDLMQAHFYKEQFGKGSKIIYIDVPKNLPQKTKLANEFILDESSLLSGKDAIKQLYKEFLGLSDETFDMAVKYGQSIEKFGSKGVIKEIKNINAKIPAMFDDVGKRLGKARTSLANNVPGADVSQQLSSVNKILGDELTSIGMLNRVADGVYSLNPEYAITAQGRTQTKSLTEFISKFFGKPQGMSSTQETLLKKAIIDGDIDLITKITRGKYFTAQTTAKFGDFAKAMKSLESQITGKEFQQLGKLSPNLTTYMQGLRGITEQVADQYGDVSVKALTKEYRMLAQNAELLRTGSKVKDIDELSKVLSKYINPKDLIEQEQARALDGFLKKQVGSDVFEKVRGFKALSQLKGLETDLTKTEARQAFVNMMKNAFSEGTSVKRDLIERNIDPFLPKHLKVALNAKNHTTAIALQNDALSILKARFLSSGIGIPALLGGATGGYLGGYKGATVGLGLGIGLQNPKILEMLLKMASKAPQQRALNIPLKGMAREPAIAGIQTLRGLVNQNR